MEMNCLNLPGVLWTDQECTSVRFNVGIFFGVCSVSSIVCLTLEEWQPRSFTGGNVSPGTCPWAVWPSPTPTPLLHILIYRYPPSTQTQYPQLNAAHKDMHKCDGEVGFLLYLAPKQYYEAGLRNSVTVLSTLCPVTNHHVGQILKETEAVVCLAV